ncbi:uncharacterized protein LOC144603064 [Rhinoraja longicauda]
MRNPGVGRQPGPGPGHRRMRRSLCTAVHLLYLLTGLHTAAVCGTRTSATVGSVTTVTMGGMVRFPVQPHSHEKIRVSMWRLHPDLPILDWKSYSPRVRPGSTRPTGTESASDWTVKSSCGPWVSVTRGPTR